MMSSSLLLRSRLLLSSSVVRRCSSCHSIFPFPSPSILNLSHRTAIYIFHQHDSLDFLERKRKTISIFILFVYFIFAPHHHPPSPSSKSNGGYFISVTDHYHHLRDNIIGISNTIGKLKLHVLYYKIKNGFFKFTITLFS